jgi:hypothetical protein
MNLCSYTLPLLDEYDPTVFPQEIVPVSDKNEPVNTGAAPRPEVDTIWCRQSKV